MQDMNNTQVSPISEDRKLFQDGWCWLLHIKHIENELNLLGRTRPCWKRNPVKRGILGMSNIVLATISAQSPAVKHQHKPFKHKTINKLNQWLSQMVPSLKNNWLNC
jgi:hypothetical protein